MTIRNVIMQLVILAVFGFGLWAVLPIDAERFGRSGMQLGLDLVGGVHLVYQADFAPDATPEDKEANMERALVTIQRRIDKYGVTEPIIQQMGADRILIQLPGFTDIDAAKSLVEQTGFLEFREVELAGEAEAVTLQTYLDQETPAFVNPMETGDRVFTDYLGYPIAILTKGADGPVFADEEGNRLNTATMVPEEIEASRIFAWVPARGNDGQQLTGDYLEDAGVLTNQQTGATEIVVGIEWDETGTLLFDDIATRLYNPNAYGEPQTLLGIFLDNNLLSAPVVNAAKFEGSGIITGSYTLDSAGELANLLNSGVLPMPLAQPPLYQEKVSATLGANFIDMSVLAGIVGLAIVMLFMIIYYRIPGLLASLALIFYGVIVLTVFKLVPVTLSLAGMGGIILTIGMAVDANVLIFERMKEEFRLGRNFGGAIEAGFNRAWSAIRDSNITTIIVCIILYWLGSSIVASAPVMGFALTLGIGVIISMLTAIVVTRTLLRLFVGSGLARRKHLFSADWGRK